MDGLKTEEFGNKKIPLKKILIILGILIFIALIVFLVVFMVNKFKKNAEGITENDNIVNLNSELDGTYAFARVDDYLVALRKDKDSKRIYNLSQGTGNLGDFLDYTYYDKKLYLLFGINNIYSISLTEGNGVYELVKEYNYLNAVCSDSTSGNTSNIVVNDRIIYFNNSGCAISAINYKKNEKQVNLRVFNSLKHSSMVYSSELKSLFFQSDNAIFKVDEGAGEVVKILDNANGNTPLTITNNVLLYSSNSGDNLYNYYGYNIKTATSSQIISNVKKLVISNKRYFYQKDNNIYVISDNKEKLVYEVHYDTISDVELIDQDVLQLVDNSNSDSEKKRIVNIDLSSDKFKTKIVSEKYSLIRTVL